MDIVKYPLTGLSAEDLLDRLEEECSELIHAIVKRRRFGVGSIHPRTGETAEERVISEANDVSIVLSEVYSRIGYSGSFKPFPSPVRGVSAEDWGLM